MHQTTRLEIDEALRQREHSPGLSSIELVWRCSAHAHEGDGDYLNPRSAIGLVLYQVYLGGLAAASHFSVHTMAGVDVTEGYSEA